MSGRHARQLDRTDRLIQHLGGLVILTGSAAFVLICLGANG